MKKKVIAFALAATMVAGLAACGSAGTESAETKAEEEEAKTEEKAEEKEEKTEEKAEEKEEKEEEKIEEDEAEGKEEKAEKEEEKLEETEEKAEEKEEKEEEKAEEKEEKEEEKGEEKEEKEEEKAEKEEEKDEEKEEKDEEKEEKDEEKAEEDEAEGKEEKAEKEEEKADKEEEKAEKEEEKAETAAEKSGSGSVYWLNFKPEADEALQDIAEVYTEQTGVPVKVVTAASGTYESTLTAEMDKSNPPTLINVGNGAGVKTWGDFCIDLKGTDVYDQLNTDDFTMYDEDGKAVSIGYCYECFGIIVNTGLLEEAGYTLDDITDFASLKEVADDIHARADELGFDAFTSSGMDDSSSWRFTGHLANMPLFYQMRDDGWTDTPATITDAYLDNFRDIWDLYITDCAFDPATLATGGYDSEAEFIDGTAVFYQNGSWEYAAISEVIPDDEIAMIPIYIGVEGEEDAGLCCGTENCWAVTNVCSEDDQQATLDFMYWLVTSEEGTEMMAEQFGEIPYKEAAENNNVFFKDAMAYMDEGKYTVDWAFNYTPNVDEWRAGLVSAMNQYDANIDDSTWDNVVTAFVQGWAQQYQAVNE